MIRCPALLVLGNKELFVFFVNTSASDLDRAESFRIKDPKISNPVALSDGCFMNIFIANGTFILIKIYSCITYC